MKSIKEQYYLDHLCPPWADEKQWQKLLDKVTFSNGEISYKGLSAREVKILEGFSFGASLEKRAIHKNERQEALIAQKHEPFSEGRKQGSRNKKTDKLVTHIKDQYLVNPRKKAFTLFMEADKKIIGSIEFKTYEGYLTAIKKKLKEQKT